MPLQGHLLAARSGISGDFAGYLSVFSWIFEYPEKYTSIQKYTDGYSGIYGRIFLDDTEKYRKIKKYMRIFPFFSRQFIVYSRRAESYENSILQPL